MGLSAEAGSVCRGIQTPGCPGHDTLQAVAVTVFRAQVLSEHLLT